MKINIPPFGAIGVKYNTIRLIAGLLVAWNTIKNGEWEITVIFFLYIWHIRDSMNLGQTKD